MGVRTCKSFYTNDGHLIEKQWERTESKPKLVAVFDKCEGREQARASLMRYISR